MRNNVLSNLRPALKKFQLWGNQNYKTIRRIMFIIVGVCLLVYVFYSLALQNQLTKQSAEIAEQTKHISGENRKLLRNMSDQNTQIKQLSLDNKALSEQSIRLADQSIRYQECTFRLFAKFTRDRRPIAEHNLNKCVAENVFFGQGTSATGNPSFQSEPTQPAPAPAPAPQQTRSQANPPQRSPNALERLINIPRGLLNFFL